MKILRTVSLGSNFTVSYNKKVYLLAQSQQWKQQNNNL